MTRLRLVMLLPLALTAQASFARGCSSIDAARAATRFLAKIDHAHAFAVPNRKELAVLREVVTPTLHTLLQQASRAEEREFARSKGKEPPLFEGSLFSSLADGYTRYLVIRPETRGTSEKVAIKFEYRGNTPATATPYVWTDFISVQTVSRKCLVSDITFGMHPPSQNSLSTLLKEISKL